MGTVKDNVYRLFHTANGSDVEEGFRFHRGDEGKDVELLMPSFQMALCRQAANFNVGAFRQHMETHWPDFCDQLPLQEKRRGLVFAAMRTLSLL